MVQLKNWEQEISLNTLDIFSYKFNMLLGLFDKGSVDVNQPY